MSDKTVTLPAELVSRIITVLDDAAKAADLGMNVDEYEETFTELRTDSRDARDNLKVAAGIAKRFDDHFTTVKVEGSEDEDAEIEYKAEVDEETLHRLWTVLDCEGELAIMPGRHYVNRLSYILTTEPWTVDDLETEWVY